MSVRVVFIVSLPRAGSTLLQKMLSVSPEVATMAEPWLMLPFWAMRQASAGRSVFSHHTGATAMNDFVNNIENGEEAYADAVGTFARRMYTAAACEKPVFLDKTPRYYLTLPFLKQALPEAQIIVLLRNPLAVLASICETFNRGRFMWYEYWVDWIEGHRSLARALREGMKKQLIVRYEQLITEPDSVLVPVCSELGIQHSESMTTAYRTMVLPGRMGDPIGINNYQTISHRSLDKWQGFFNTTYRRQVAEKMLKKLDPQDLATLGYPVDTLLEALHSTPPRSGLDLRSRYEYALGSVAQVIDFKYLQARWRAHQNRDSFAYGYYRV